MTVKSKKFIHLYELQFPTSKQTLEVYEVGANECKKGKESVNRKESRIAVPIILSTSLQRGAKLYFREL